MSIHRPKKKILKAKSGLNTDQLYSAVQQGVGAIPGIGTAVSAAMGIGKAIFDGAQAKKAAKKAAVKEDRIELNNMQKESNSLFGQLTYADGGETPDKAPGLTGVQDKAVVLDGKRHKDGGNDVLDATTGEKVAETEAEELLFTRKQTEQIEAYIAEHSETKDDESLHSLGALVKKIVDNDMVDYSGKFK